MQNQVLNFIKKFKFKYDKQIEYVFMSGNCYYFAIILKERFQGEIYYLPIFNHFVCKIDNNYYDITGIACMNETPIKWSTFKQTNRHNAQQIIRDCIEFTTRPIPK